MNELLISVIVVLIAVIIALAAAIIIKNRRLSALKRSIDSFMRGGEPFLSLKDDKLSQLENSVGELENACCLKRRTRGTPSGRTNASLRIYRTSSKLRLRVCGSTARWTEPKHRPRGTKSSSSL